MVFLHRGFPRRLGLVAGRDAERLVIVERDHVEDQVFQRRVVRAQQRLGAAGAFLRGQPDDGRALRIHHGLGDLHARGR